MLTTHALLRCEHRAITRAQAEYVLQKGAQLQQPCGRLAYHFGRREAMWQLRSREHIPKGVHGLVVVVASDGYVVTVYRTRVRHQLRKRACARRKSETQRSARLTRMWN